MDKVTEMQGLFSILQNSNLHQPVRGYLTKSFLKDVKERATIQDKDCNPPPGAMISFMGLSVYESDLLPQGCMALFLDKDNLPVGMIVDDTYKPVDDGEKT